MNLKLGALNYSNETKEKIEENCMEILFSLSLSLALFLS